MRGDDLLFQRFSGSTIGAVRFHGRVRDGIGWGTDAMVTKQWSRRISTNWVIDAVFSDVRSSWSIVQPITTDCAEILPFGIHLAVRSRAELSLMVEFPSMNRVIRTG